MGDSSSDSKLVSGSPPTFAGCRPRRGQDGDAIRHGQSAGSTTRRQPGTQENRSLVPFAGSPSRFTGIAAGAETSTHASRIRTA